MDVSFCQSCKTSPAQLLCKCTEVYLCEQCIGGHIMQVFHLKHKPIKLSAAKSLDHPKLLPQDLHQAIYSKLLNELLELEEFRKLALQKISELLQQAEKELLETAEKTMVSLSEICENAHREISDAISLLNLNGHSSNYILQMFGQCNCVEDVRDLFIVHKTLDYSQFNVAEIVRSSIVLNLQISRDPVPVIPSRPGAIFETLNFELKSSNLQSKLLGSGTAKTENFITDIEKLSSISTIRKTMSNIELELLGKTITLNSISRSLSKSLTTFQGLTPSIYYFVPNTNRIAWYSIEIETWNEFSVPNRIFLKDSAWSLCEGGKIMNTGGYEFQPKDCTFLFDLDTKKEEKVPNLPEKRCKHAQVSLGNFVYVIGGTGKNGSLKSIDKFNLDTNKWKKVGNMSVPREDPGAVSHDGKIYIIGGTGCSSIESYNPLTKKIYLLNIKTSGPGRNCLFSYDDYILILKDDTLTKFTPKSLNTTEKAKVLHCDWMMKGEPYVTKNLCYFFFLNELFKLDLSSNSINLIGQVP